MSGTVRKSKRLNVVQSRAEYTNGDCDKSEHSLMSRDSMSETQELEDSEDQVGRRDDRVDNISGMILIKKDQQLSSKKKDQQF